MREDCLVKYDGSGLVARVGEGEGGRGENPVNPSTLNLNDQELKIYSSTSSK